MKLAIVAAILLSVGNVVFAADATQPAFTSPPVEKNGLQVTLIGDKSVFANNEPIRFTVRFKNISAKPVSLGDGDQFDDWWIRLESVTNRMPWSLQKIDSGRAKAAKAVYSPRELKPGESCDVSTDWGSNAYPFRFESELILNMPIPPADNLSPGRYRLWVGISLQKDPDVARHSFVRGDFNLGPVEIEISDRIDPAGPLASEPVTENSAEFQTVTRTTWHVPAAGAKSEVLLGLRIVNRTATWMQVNVFDTVDVVLEDAHGARLRCVRERDVTAIPEPLVLESRESRTIYADATLQWPENGKALCLTGSDGAGGHWRFDDLKPGKYTVYFVYENDKERLKPVLDRPAKHKLDGNEAPFWMGKATTRSLAVEIQDRR